MSVGIFFKNLTRLATPGEWPLSTIPVNKKDKSIETKANIAFRYTFWFGFVAVVMLFLYSLGQTGIFLDRTCFNWFNLGAILGVVIGLAFASAAVGAIIGFLFGIPHTLQQNTLISSGSTGNVNTAQGNTASTVNSQFNSSQTVSPAPSPTSTTNTGKPSQASYAPSTNLEQIADWLTKIIVGVGLTEIHKILYKFNELSFSIGNTIKSYSYAKQDGSTMAGIVIIIFTIEGFLIVYLWTHLYLIHIQNSMFDPNEIIDNIKQSIKDSDHNDKRAIDLVTMQLNEAYKDIDLNELTEAFKGATPKVLGSVFCTAVKYRTESNLTDKIKAGRTIPIFKALINLDPGHHAENYLELAFAFMMLSTPDWNEAIKNLDAAINRFTGTDTKIVALAYFKRAICRIKIDENFSANPPAPSSDTNKTLIKTDLDAANKNQEIEEIKTEEEKQIENQWQQLNSATDNQ